MASYCWTVPDKKSGFKPEQINNRKNVVSIPHGKASIHAKISAFYSSKPRWTNGITVREWLSGKSYEEQFEFGLNVLKKYGNVIETEDGFIYEPL